MKWVDRVVYVLMGFACLIFISRVIGITQASARFNVWEWRFYGGVLNDFIFIAIPLGFYLAVRRAWAYYCKSRQRSSTAKRPFLESNLAEGLFWFTFLGLMISAVIIDLILWCNN